ncbi:UNVERIFIED_CONTAM: nitrite reductase (NADH) large subunit [Acetivibrio alkalicellulosi]
MKHVIIGNGAAGISAAEKLRSLDDSSEITIVSNEDAYTYTKFMLPDYVGNKISREKLFLRDAKNYENNRIDIMLGEEIDLIDYKNKCVNLLSGQKKEYDKLLVAVGAKPVVPDIEGLKDSNYLTINSIREADTIKNRAVRGQKAIIIGGGLTGIETAFGLKRLGMNVAIVERENSLLPQHLDEVCASVLKKQVNNEGIETFLSKNVTRVSSGKNNFVQFSDGDSLNFDMLIVAIGTKPQLDIIKGTDIKCKRGILVNEYLESSIKDIFSAGDVAELENCSVDGYVSGYIWSNAMAQGKCAALNMVGKKEKFSSDEACNNSVRLRDVPFVSMGLIKPDEIQHEVVVHFDSESNVYKKMILKDNKIKGMIFFGDMKSANIVAEHIRKNKDITDIKDMVYNGN